MSAFLLGLVGAAWTLVRHASPTGVARAPLAAFGFCAVGLCMLWLPADAAAQGLTGALLVRAAGVLLFLAALGVALWASRERLWAEALRGAEPELLEAAVLRGRGKHGSGVRLLRGRLAATRPVTSPGGIVCAAYAAELRQARLAGQGRGTLLSSERRMASGLALRGGHIQVGLGRPPVAFLGPVAVRHCLTSSRLAANDTRVFAEGHAPAQDALSYERVGKLGEPCLVLGEVRADPLTHRPIIRGPAGSRPLLVTGGDVAQVAHALVQRSWRRFGCAAGLFVAAAWLLTRGS